MQITFIQGHKETIIGKTKTKEVFIYVRSYIDGDENPKKLKNAAVEDFDSEPSEAFLKKGLEKCFPGGIFTDDSVSKIVLPKGFVLPEGFTLKQLAKTLKNLHLDEHNVPLTHITRL